MKEKDMYYLLCVIAGMVLTALIWVVWKIKSPETCWPLWLLVCYLLYVGISFGFPFVLSLLELHG